ncbi:hypothetical protein [Anaerotignum sp. MB30-C6]|uniref:hypothetical protein n=1 Tax=Anaerotignum sp. MB30-C6 TaxID=3070814 RepID=UPI0027DCB369|nr:hypothetical protein [Anaerotignum sp. MB30-C6]WMI81474.1 hypothetical protein RBQ60_01710 [Anaerotignum sp. MB30-C6]
MFSKPSNGWTDVVISEFEGQASYLTDVPMDCLKGCIFALKNKVPFSFFFDEEGSECIITSHGEYTYILHELDQTQVYKLELPFLALAKEIAQDIEAYLDEWINWFTYLEEEDLERTEALKNGLVELKELLENQ